MKLVFIYGPPGVGKLTVAEELAKITGYKVFHNHLTYDLIKSLFEDKIKTKELVPISSEVRLPIFKYAAKLNLNLIFTFFYSKENEDFIKDVVNVVESNGGEICFVQLKCSREELDKRVEEESRKRYGKIQAAQKLKKTFERWEPFTKITEKESLVIDNTSLSVKDTALKIKRYYNL